ncbi:aminodeoxychorismate synthase component I [Nocardia sp. NPDC050710]|uniref:aminodeoxychorismate synthase component I n=1 Tax=Nocardia sp. NPDC050710 TaxID=3157220 RepID=UPI003402A507
MADTPERSTFGVARFDDRRSGRSTVFHDRRTVISAQTLDAVRPAVARAEELARGGNWVYGFVSYEAAPAFDAALHVRGSAGEGGRMPLCWFGAVPPAHVTSADSHLLAGGRYRVGDWRIADPVERYHAAVTAIREHIDAGEIYQANLTTRISTTMSGDLTGVYADLLDAQTCSYGAYIDTGEHVILSASPELFFHWTEGRVTTRPMKGTSPRGRDLAEDAALQAQLSSSAKERAENLMIVDLLRNDLARIPGARNIRVRSLFDSEPYETVWQLTSQITADVPAQTSLEAVFAALFPCGSITGAPKYRSMEIISELETTPRGLYCGAIGIIAPTGDHGIEARFSVAIRTLVHDRARGISEYGVGGGVTWDSTPHGEYAEALAKARILDRLNSIGPPLPVHSALRATHPTQKAG